MSVSKSSKSITAVTRRIRERHGGSRTCSHVLWEGKHIYSSWPEIGSLLLGNIPYRVDTSGSVPIFFGSLILTPLFVWEVPRVPNKLCMGACSLFINVLDLYISLTFPLVVNVRGVFVFQLVKRAHVWNAFLQYSTSTEASWWTKKQASLKNFKKFEFLQVLSYSHIYPSDESGYFRTVPYRP